MTCKESSSNVKMWHEIHFRRTCQMSNDRRVLKWHKIGNMLRSRFQNIMTSFESSYLDSGSLKPFSSNLKGRWIKIEKQASSRRSPSAVKVDFKKHVTRGDEVVVTWFSSHFFRWHFWQFVICYDSVMNVASRMPRFHICEADGTRIEEEAKCSGSWREDWRRRGNSVWIRVKDIKRW